MKCKCCKKSELIQGHDTIKQNGAKYELYVCPNCDDQEWVITKISNNRKAV